KWACGICGKNGCGTGAIKCSTVEVHGKYRNRTDRVGGDAGGRSEVRDQKILRNVVVVDAIAAANHRILGDVPRKANAWSKVVQITVVHAVKSVRADHREGAILSEIRQQVMVFAHRTEILPAQT